MVRECSSSKLGTAVFINGSSTMYESIAVYGWHEFLVGYCSVQIKQEGLLGILKTSVVIHCTNRIGDAMVKHRIKWLQEQNVQTIKSYAWFVDGVVPAQKMLMNNGFEPRDDIRGYWNKDHNKAFPCKICGENCQCVARIFEYKG